MAPDSRKKSISATQHLLFWTFWTYGHKTHFDTSAETSWCQATNKIWMYGWIYGWMSGNMWMLSIYECNLQMCDWQCANVWMFRALGLMLRLGFRVRVRVSICSSVCRSPHSGSPHQQSGLIISSAWHKETRFHRPITWPWPATFGRLWPVGASQLVTRSTRHTLKSPKIMWRCHV